jgi:hypothetical protein
MPTLSLLTVVSSTPLNDATGLAQFTMCPFWQGIRKVEV